MLSQTCYSMPDKNPSVIPLTPLGTLVPIISNIFTASLATFVKNLAAYDTKDINKNSITSIASWCNQPI